MSASRPDNAELQMNAYFDGELDAASARVFERRLADDAFLKAEYARFLSLRHAVRSIAPYDLPSDLLARIASTLDASSLGKAARPAGVASQVTPLHSPGRSRQRSWSFRALAAAALLGAVISSYVMVTINRYNLRQAIASQVVASHIRSLMAPQPFDVASSDSRTVKPWFTARVHEAPSPRSCPAGIHAGRRPRRRRWPRCGCNDRLQARRPYHQPDDATARSIGLGPGHCRIQRPQLGRCRVHLHGRFRLAPRRACRLRARLHDRIGGVGIQLEFPPSDQVRGHAFSDHALTALGAAPRFLTIALTKST